MVGSLRGVRCGNWGSPGGSCNQHEQRRRQGGSVGPWHGYAAAAAGLDLQQDVSTAGSGVEERFCWEPAGRRKAKSEDEEGWTPPGIPKTTVVSMLEGHMRIQPSSEAE